MGLEGTQFFPCPKSRSLPKQSLHFQSVGSSNQAPYSSKGSLMLSQINGLLPEFYLQHSYEWMLFYVILPEYDSVGFVRPSARKIYFVATQQREGKKKKRQCKIQSMRLKSINFTEMIHHICAVWRPRLLDFLCFCLVVMDLKKKKKKHYQRLSCCSVLWFLCFCLSHQAQALKTSSTRSRAKISQWK